MLKDGMIEVLSIHLDGGRPVVERSQHVEPSVLEAEGHAAAA